MKSGQQVFDVLGPEILETIIFKIDEQDIVTASFSGTQKIGDYLIEKICFARAPRAYDGQNRP
jgi:hypothetical protein